METMRNSFVAAIVTTKKEEIALIMRRYNLRYICKSFLSVIRISRNLKIRKHLNTISEYSTKYMLTCNNGWIVSNEQKVKHMEDKHPI